MLEFGREGLLLILHPSALAQVGSMVLPSTQDANMLATTGYTWISAHHFVVFGKAEISISRFLIHSNTNTPKKSATVGSSVPPIHFFPLSFFSKYVNHLFLRSSFSLNLLCSARTSCMSCK